MQCPAVVCCRMYKCKNMLATTSITTLSCTLSSNFIYMNHGTLYMVSVRHSASYIIQAFIYSVNTVLV